MKNSIDKVKTMKINYFILVIFSAFTCNAFAQFNTGEGNKYKWGCAVAVNDAQSQIAFLAAAGLDVDEEGNMISGGKKNNKSFSLSIIPKYYINNQWIIRFEYGMTRINLKDFTVPTSSSGYYANTVYPITYDTVKENINKFAVGLQWNFFTTKRIQSYGGINIPFIKYGTITRNTYNEQRNVKTDTLVYKERDVINIPGGFATGLGVFAGFNVFVFKHISLGTEFSSALLYYNIGGESSFVSSVQNIPASIQTTTNISNESYKGTRFTKIISSFNISVWF